jgi:hypothetical protein
MTLGCRFGCGHSLGEPDELATLSQVRAMTRHERNCKQRPGGKLDHRPMRKKTDAPIA